MGRRFRLIACTCLFALPLLTASVLAQSAPIRLVLFGDSYISSYGVEPSRAFGPQLEAALNAKGPQVQVVGTGFTGTSWSGAGRLESLFAAEGALAGSGATAVILELGSNDCGRFKVAETKGYLDKILNALSERNIPVLLVGTTPYDHCERKGWENYNADYAAMFVDLANQHGDLYYRDFKDGVGDHPDLMQSDHDHPTAEGDAVIVARMLPVVSDLIALAQR